MHHPCVLDDKASGIDPIEAKQGKYSRKRPLMASMRGLKYFLQPQFLFKVTTELARPVVKIAGDNQGSFPGNILLNIGGEFPRMLQAFPMGQSKMRADQRQKVIILPAHVCMQNSPRLLPGGFRQCVIAPLNDGIAA
jgi:hypothetical protein